MKPEAELYQLAKQELGRIQGVVSNAEAEIIRAIERYERSIEDNFGFPPTINGCNDAAYQSQERLKNWEPLIPKWQALVDWLATDGATTPPKEYKEYLRWLIHSRLKLARESAVKAVVAYEQALAQCNVLEAYGEPLGRADQVLEWADHGWLEARADLHKWDQIRHHATRKWDLEEIPFKPLIRLDESEAGKTQ